MDKAAVKKVIESGEATLGIEFGSTRIKAVLIDKSSNPLQTSGYEWENELVDNIWTYRLEDAIKGMRTAYADLSKNVFDEFGVHIKKLAAIGISGMMHGYLVFDRSNQLLTPFRTWRNNITEAASTRLTSLFNYPVPQRWSVAHLQQSIMNKEAHLADISFMTTLAGYIHWKLTGEKVMGVGEASGMFPIDIATKDFNLRMLEKFDESNKEEHFEWQLRDILPKVLVAGEKAGALSKAGAKLLDISGNLEADIPLCPPEGDAGTGMVATNSVTERTGNVSAGTSVFACIVLEKDLSKVYEEIDQVTTPDGNLVAMAHSNNCTSDLNAWVELFESALNAFGVNMPKGKIFETLFNEALKGEPDGGGLVSYPYLSGEHMTHFEEGRPLFAREENSRFTLPNFMRTHLYAALSAMRIGLDILFEQESVSVDEILGHGGFFKTEGVGQRMMAAVVNAPVTVMTTASEGGAWGMAVLARYMLDHEAFSSLGDFLNDAVFASQDKKAEKPLSEDVEGFNLFLNRYKAGLSIEKEAVNKI